MRVYLVIIFFSINGVVLSQPRLQSDKLYKEAQESYRKRELYSARDLIDQAIQAETQPEFLYLSGLIFEAMGKELRAISDYEATLQVDPEYQEARFQKAIIYLKHGNPQLAIDDFTQLINGGVKEKTRGIYFEIDPYEVNQNRVVSLQNIESRLYYYRGLGYEKLDQNDKAMKDLNQAIEIDKQPDHYIARGTLYESMGNSALAEQDFKAVIMMNPYHQLAWYNLALISDTSIPQEVLNQDAFAPSLSLLASQSYEKGDFDKALRYYDLSIVNYQNDPLTLINRGRLLLKINQFDRAKDDFQKAYQLDLEYSEALYLIANSFFYQEEYSSALVYYNQYLAIEATNGSVWYNAGVSYLEIKEYEEACHCLNQASAHGFNRAVKLEKRYCN